MVVADGAAALPGRAGDGTVTGNLTEATVAVFGISAQALMSLVAAKPELGQALASAGRCAGSWPRWSRAWTPRPWH